MTNNTNPFNDVQNSWASPIITEHEINAAIVQCTNHLITQIAQIQLSPNEQKITQVIQAKMKLKYLSELCNNNALLESTSLLLNQCQTIFDSMWGSVNDLFNSNIGIQSLFTTHYPNVTSLEELYQQVVAPTGGLVMSNDEV